MKVKKNTEEGKWELEVDNKIIDTLFITHNQKLLGREQARIIFCKRMYLRLQGAKALMSEILNSREDYKVILMPDWVEHAEEFINDNR